METISVILLFLTVQKCTEQRETPSTLGVHARVALLKFQLTQEIQKNREKNINEKEEAEKDDVSGSYEYVNRENGPITPIMDYDQRKKHRKFKLRELKSTTATIKGDDNFDDDSSLVLDESTSIQNDMRSLKEVFTYKKKKLRNKSNSTFIEPIANQKPRKKGRKMKRKAHRASNTSQDDNSFYRRSLFISIDLPTQAVQCEDLITPFITGSATQNITTQKIHTVSDTVVVRLIQLISEDVTQMSKEEIYSILYQISNLNIRLFQWDPLALRLLFNAFCKRDLKTHTFSNLKHGLKKTFDSWHLDYSNATNLLKQTRLFRPPCIKASHHGGSTKTSRGVYFTKSKTTKCSHAQTEADESGGEALD